MRARQGSWISRLTATVAAAGLVLTGCTGNDRAGGSAGTSVLTLTLGNPNGVPGPPLLAFADNVGKLSHGELKIAFTNDLYHGDADFESRLVKDVQHGALELGWVGPRVFDLFGVTTFQPLLAPLVVDSQELQEKVFAAGIPDEMLAGVAQAGVVGVGVLPGPLRRPMSKGDALTSPVAFKGKVVGTQPSDLAFRTYQALGATTVGLGSGASIDNVDAYDPQISVLWGNHYEEHGAKNVVGNLNVWPRPLAIIASRTAWQRLTPGQQAVLHDAAKVSQAPALDASRREDTEGVANLCKAGVAMPTVSPDELAAFETALQPVYDSVTAASPANKAWLEQIRALKSADGSAPDAVTCAGAGGTSQQAAGALPNGTYAYTFTPNKDVPRFCTREDPGWRNVAPSLGHRPYRVEMDIEGESVRQYDYLTGVRQVGWTGTYRTFRSTLELSESGTTETVTFDYTFDGKTLTLANPRTMDCDGLVVWTSHPWVLDATAPTSAAIPENVSFFTTMSSQDWADCPPGEGRETNEIVFRDGLVYLYNLPQGTTNRILGFKEGYTVFRDKLTVGAYTVTWKLTGKTLVLSDLTGGECGDRVIWTAHPWTRK